MSSNCCLSDRSFSISTLTGMPRKKSTRDSPNSRCHGIGSTIVTPGGVPCRPCNCTVTKHRLTFEAKERFATTPSEQQRDNKGGTTKRTTKGTRTTKGRTTKGTDPE